jgi:hypothetical protein
MVLASTRWKGGPYGPMLNRKQGQMTSTTRPALTAHDGGRSYAALAERTAAAADAVRELAEVMDADDVLRLPAAAFAECLVGRLQTGQLRPAAQGRRARP